jgi:hypothetical protein
VAADFAIGTFNVTNDLKLSNVTLNVSGSVNFDDADPVQSLVGPGKIVLGTGAHLVNFSQSTLGATGGKLTISNDVVIESSGSGGVRGNHLVSNGTLRSLAGGALDISAADIVNNGLIDVFGRTRIGSAQWHNSGSIVIHSGGKLELGGQFTVDDYGSITDQGAQSISVVGTLDNTGRTLDVAGLGWTVPLTLTGTIRGGRVVSSTPGRLLIPGSNGGGFLDGVTLGADITIPGGAGGGQLHIENGMSLDNSTITMPNGAQMTFDGTVQTLNGQGLVLAKDQPLTSAITTIGGDKLVIGPGITIRNGTTGFRELQVFFAENQGTIISEAPQTLVTIGSNGIVGANGSAWTNKGTFRITDGLMRLTGNYTSGDIGNVQFTGGELELDGNINNQGRVIRQDSSTGVWKFRAQINGGRFEVADGVVADVAGRFTSVTLAGQAKLVDEPNSTALGDLWLTNSLTLDHGILTVDPSAELDIDTKVSIDGQGEIVLNGGGTLPSLIQTYNGGEVTIGSEIIVHTGLTGGGTISRGTLPVINKGIISGETAGQKMVVDGALTNLGTLRAISGGELDVQSSNWSNQGKLVLGTGLISINGTGFTNGASGTTSGNGTIHMSKSDFVNQGTISPGASAGHLRIEGNLREEASSVLQIELGGRGAGKFDTLEVTGNIVLNGGTLNLSLIDGFSPFVGDQFQILSGTSIIGKFSNALDSISIGNLVFRVEYGAKSVTLTMVTVPEPASLIMALSGLGMLCVTRFSRRMARRN